MNLISENCSIQVDAATELGPLPRELGGLLTDPPRGPGLHMDDADPEGFNVHWLPTVKPSYIGLGWGGDVWYAYRPWVGEGEYDFSPLVARIKEYKAGGQEPRMNFCWVPEWLWDNEKYDDNHDIAGGPAQTIFHYLMKGFTRPPKDYAKWRKLVSDTVYHLNEVEKLGVEFDLLNEPNIDWFWNASLEELNEFYKETSEAVRSASPNTRVGGPGFAMNSQHPEDWQWFEAWVKYVAENRCPLDFISWHSYLLPSLQHKRAMNFGQQAAKLRGIMKKYPGIGDPDFYITEWSYFWDLREQPVAGFNGAFVAQSLREMLEAGCSKALYCGPLGPLNAPDSATQALYMYNKLAAYRIEAELADSESSVDIIATGEPGRISIMLWDFPFSADEGVPQRFKDEKDLEKIPGKAVKIDLSNLGKGTYTLTRSSTGDGKKDGLLQKVEKRKVISDGTLSVEFDLSPYSVSQIELSNDG